MFQKNKKKYVLRWKKKKKNKFNILTSNYEAFCVMSRKEVGFMAHKVCRQYKEFHLGFTAKERW